MLSCLCFNSRRDSVDVVKKQADEQPSQNVNSDSDDPRIPLTMKQKFVLTKNWKGIAREVTEAGANMFVKLLSENKQYFVMFEFRDVAQDTKEHQLNNEKLRNHGESVMGVIGKAISSIEDSQTFFNILEETGRKHAYKHHFQPEMFWKMEQPFLYAVKLILSDRYTENMDEIYKTVIHLMLTKLEEACKDELKRKADAENIVNVTQ